MYQGVLDCTPEQCGIGVTSSIPLPIFLVVISIISISFSFVYLAVELVMKKKLSLKKTIIFFIITEILMLTVGWIFVHYTLKSNLTLRRPYANYNSGDIKLTYQESKQKTYIDISAVDTSSWSTRTLFNKIIIKTPPDWTIRKPEQSDPSAVTFGLGIRSNLTLRYGQGEKYIKDRVDRMKAKNYVTKETVVVNGKEYTTYYAVTPMRGDVGGATYRDWYLVNGYDVFVISDDSFPSSPDYKINAAVISSIKYILVGL